RKQKKIRERSRARCMSNWACPTDAKRAYQHPRPREQRGLGFLCRRFIKPAFAPSPHSSALSRDTDHAAPSPLEHVAGAHPHRCR
uniref:Uncharacterized protein n=1 Tax=Aegilops tauschii subsp. strangulata TaxID=200361 RepID=A0A453RCL8_AEGTS